MRQNVLGADSIVMPEKDMTIHSYVYEARE